MIEEEQPEVNLGWGEGIEIKACLHCPINFTDMRQHVTAEFLGKCGQ